MLQNARADLRKASRRPSGAGIGDSHGFSDVEHLQSEDDDDDDDDDGAGGDANDGLREVEGRPEGRPSERGASGQPADDALATGSFVEF